MSNAQTAKSSATASTSRIPRSRELCWHHERSAGTAMIGNQRGEGVRRDGVAGQSGPEREEERRATGGTPAERIPTPDPRSRDRRRNHPGVRTQVLGVAALAHGLEPLLERDPGCAAQPMAAGPIGRAAPPSRSRRGTAAATTRPMPRQSARSSCVAPTVQAPPHGVGEPFAVPRLDAHRRARETGGRSGEEARQSRANVPREWTIRQIARPRRDEVGTSRPSMCRPSCRGKVIARDDQVHVGRQARPRGPPGTRSSR